MQFIYAILAISFSSSIVLIFAFLMAERAAKLRYPFIFLLACIAIWSFGYIFELAGTTIHAKLFWAKFEYLGIATISLPWLFLVLKYAGKDRFIKQKFILPLLIEPLATLLLVWTNEHHHLIWTSIGIERYANLSILNFEYGAWAKIHTIYMYLLLSFTLILLLQIVARSYHLYKKQAITLFIASFIPFMGHISYVMRLSKFDITPFSFLLSCIAFIFLFKAGRIDILPIAKENIIESMREGIIAMDRNNKILYINSAGAKILGIDGNEVIGKDFSYLKQIQPRIFHKKRKELKIRGRNYEINYTPLYGEYGEEIGHLIIFNDITERKVAEKKLQEALEREKEIKLNMAHYFFNPIAIAKGFLSLKIEEGGNGKIKKAMEAVERIEKVVKNIITKGEIKE